MGEKVQEIINTTTCIAQVSGSIQTMVKISNRYEDVVKDILDLDEKELVGGECGTIRANFIKCCTKARKKISKESAVAYKNRSDIVDELMQKISPGWDVDRPRKVAKKRGTSQSRSTEEDSNPAGMDLEGGQDENGVNNRSSQKNVDDAGNEVSQ